MPTSISETDLILNANGSVYHLGLHSEDLTDIILTVGDPERVTKVSQYFDRIDIRRSHREFHAHIGWIGKQRVMVISSGMGTDNVEILLTELDALANVNLVDRTVNETHRKLTIVRIGTSGSLQADIPVDSYIANQHAFGVDTLMQFYPFRMQEDQAEWSRRLSELLEIGFVPYCATAASRLLVTWKDCCTFGTTLTCPGFYAPQGRQVRVAPSIAQLPEKLASFRFDGQRLTNFEMETAGYYALGQLLNHDVISLNAVLANRATQKFSVNPTKTIATLIEKVLDKVETIL